MILLPIQEEKISKVVNKLNCPEFTNKYPLYFQSPTGSGKTKMLARIIEEYKHSNPQDKLLFLVASISTGGIEWQNYKSLKNSQNDGCDYRVNHIPSGLDSTL
jgi:chromosomal replication initiation ATPase DnaA